ncbi:DUF1643 domain-containing protein [Pseudanabaena sp. FACHB-2040]|uniref:DUF1643 domain-containing protein n=1 Tax=Pseudanabaena sp. FACHB-2040 TaxID=2692859 RepID=UPI001684BAB4|nr:DUF1643 domain-containing protein [Pseudanabaena sp. FACHB-2040]
MYGTACFDTSGTYRYTLSRRWDEARPTIAFVMLNPSQANDAYNDPTIRRCIGLAQQWGYGRLEVVNLFAYCSAHPRDLTQVKDPIGPENDQYLLSTCEQAERVLLAWGNWGSRLGRDRTVLTLLEPHWVKCCSLGLNQTGLPRHPLYVKRDSQLLPWQLIGTGVDAAL